MLWIWHQNYPSRTQQEGVMEGFSFPLLFFLLEFCFVFHFLHHCLKPPKTFLEVQITPCLSQWATPRPFGRQSGGCGHAFYDIFFVIVLSFEETSFTCFHMPQCRPPWFTTSNNVKKNKKQDMLCRKYFIIKNLNMNMNSCSCMLENWRFFYLRLTFHFTLFFV